MAKVKITGHASGTGVVTVTAPNTSTDRTITLPDATATIATTADVAARLPSITDGGNATAMTIDSNEHIGIGVAPSGWGTSTRAVQLKHYGALSTDEDGNYYGTNLTQNAYSVGGGAEPSVWKYVTSNTAARPSIYQLYDGGHHFSTAPTGSADATMTVSSLLSITNDGRGLSQFTAKAWVNFNGANTVAINDSHNVSSITDNGTGNYSINFSNNLANANYSVTSMSKAYSQYGNYSDSFGTFNVAWFKVEHREGSSYTDAQKFCANVFGD